MLSLSLSGSALRPAGYLFAQYQTVIPAGTPYSALFEPEFWVNVAGKLEKHYEVRAVAEDGTFDALLTVASRKAIMDGLFHITMRELRCWRQPLASVPDIPEPASSERETLEDETSDRPLLYSWGGPAQGHRIKDRAGNIVAKGFESKSAALSAIDNMLKQREAA